MSSSACAPASSASSPRCSGSAMRWSSSRNACSSARARSPARQASVPVSTPAWRAGPRRVSAARLSPFSHPAWQRAGAVRRRPRSMSAYRRNSLCRLAGSNPGLLPRQGSTGAALRACAAAGLPCRTGWACAGGGRTRAHQVLRDVFGDLLAAMPVKHAEQGGAAVRLELEHRRVRVLLRHQAARWSAAPRSRRGRRLPHAMACSRRANYITRCRACAPSLCASPAWRTRHTGTARSRPRSSPAGRPRASAPSRARHAGAPARACAERNESCRAGLLCHRRAEVGSHQGCQKLVRAEVDACAATPARPEQRQEQCRRVLRQRRGGPSTRTARTALHACRRKFGAFPTAGPRHQLPGKQNAATQYHHHNK